MRRLIWWLIGFAAAVFVLFAVAVALRAELVKRAAEAYLAERGFPRASISVSHIGLGRAAFDKLALGPGLPTVERIEARYRIVELLDLRLRAVRIDGLRAVVDAREPEAMKRLALLAPRGARSRPAATGPEVALRDGRVTLRNTGAGEVTFAFDGSVDLSQARGQASLKAEARGAFGRASLTARIDDLLNRPSAELRGSGDAELALLPWPDRLGRRPQGGKAEFSFSGTVPLPSLNQPFLAGLLAREGGLTIDLKLRDAELPPYAASADATASLAARTGGGVLVLRLVDHAAVTARGLPKAMPQALDEAELTLSATGKGDKNGGTPRGSVKISAHLADDEVEATVRAEMVWAAGEELDVPMQLSADLRARGVSLAGSRVNSLSWKGEGSVAAGLANLSGPLAARLPVLRGAGLAAEGVAIEGKLDVSGGRETAAAATLLGGNVRVSSLPAFGRLRIKGPVSFAIPFARAKRAPGGAGLEARIVPEAVNATLAPQEKGPMDLTVTAKEIRVSLQVADGVTGRLRLRGGAVRIPEHNIEGSKIAATVPYPLRPGGEAALLSGLVRETSDPAFFVPLRVSARVTPRGEALRLTGTIRQPGLDVRIPVRGQVLRSGRQGRIAFGPVTMAFQPGALQPAMLGAVLAAVRRAVGVVALSGALAFTPDSPLDGEATIDFRDLTAETAQGRIEGLGGTLRLEGLFPPRTAGVQTLSARRAVVGLPLDKPSVRFRLHAAKSRPIVLIDRAEGRIADGLVYLDRARFDPFAARNALDIGVRGLSLERLLGDWAMQKIAGTGILSGVIPVVLTSEGVIIDTGKLRAEGSGVLRVNWGASRDALMRQSEEVALMVRALEDFHYSTLQITLDRPPDGSLSIKVTMEGRNPAVKEGYPFRFNISFSGDLEKILVAVREGQRLGADLLRGGIGGAR